VPAASERLARVLAGETVTTEPVAHHRDVGTVTELTLERPDVRARTSFATWVAAAER